MTAPSIPPAAAPQTGWSSPRRLLQLSVAVAVVTIGLKTGAWALTGSVALLSDAMESFVNLAGAVFALLMLAVAQRPADDSHPYGHEKAEYFSSGFEGLLIMAAAAAILWAAGRRLSDLRPVAQPGWGLALAGVSSLRNAGMAWAMLRAARVHRSMALEGDAHHLLTDVWTSAAVILGVLLAVLTGWLWLDPLLAALVALNILWAGGRLLWRSVQGLMDQALEPELNQRIAEVLAGFDQPGLHFNHLQTRRAGARRFADVHLHLPSSWTLAQADGVRQAVEQALLAAVPGLVVTVQILPDGSEPQAHGQLGDLL
ncbi:MAG: Ferrous-iron efflux pump FieF [Paracidovorax wautersii]|uniref:Ferrous-iron efflux pump FieF n=1 Tax=Paracidovorax wautersii TaxID=1177982 RepID=A0A7V8FRJ1_9BURK|nr:MAG: Ferrous-iron efflux pump FieF [Paracidovorax wautersii]